MRRQSRTKNKELRTKYKDQNQRSKTKDPRPKALLKVMRIQILQPVNGLSPEIGFLLAGMDEVREQLRKTVGELSVEDTGRLAFPEAHSIGGLVLHIGEAEWWWMQCVVSGRPATDAEGQPYWDILEEPQRVPEKGYSAQFCLDEIAAIREQTLSVLAKFGDEALEQIITFERDGKLQEYSLRWILHHLIDHEAQHKGQILMMKRMMGLKND